MMRLRSVLLAAGAAAVGYVFGTRAGRIQFEHLKARAGELASDPRVRSQVSNLASEVRRNASHLPDPVAGLVRTAADKVESATQQTSAPPPPPPPPATPPPPPPMP